MRDGGGDGIYGEVAVVGTSRGSDGSDAVLIVRSVCHGMVVSWQLWEVVVGRGDGCVIRRWWRRRDHEDVMVMSW